VDQEDGIDDYNYQKYPAIKIARMAVDEKLSMAVQKVLNHSGIKVLTSTTFALARNERGDAETRGGYRYEGFIPPGIEHIRDIQDHRIQ